MKSRQKPKGTLAVACSGLGWVRRGNETWARGLGELLASAGEPVVLYGGGECPVQCRFERLWNVRRDAFPWPRHVPWHVRYLWEQRTFSWSLGRRLRQERGGLLHLADPLLAELMRRRAREWGIRVAYKDGMRLGPEWCARFDWVQVLAPHYKHEAEKRGVDVRRWFVIPHSVDTKRFHPAADSVRARRECPGGALPPKAFVGLVVGDFAPDSRKRLDWLVTEFARLPESLQAHLVVVGNGKPREIAAFERRMHRVLGDRLQIRTNLDRDALAGLYRAADVFVHAALMEPFGIVFLEAMASGLPTMAHAYEVTRWILGDAGEVMDMEKPGELAGRLEAWIRMPELRRVVALAARERALSVFDSARILPLYQEMHGAMRHSEWGEVQ